MKTNYVIGVMSGTSLDGIDVALCKIEGTNKDLKCETIAFQTFNYAEGIKERIVAASFDDTSSVSLITELHYQLGHEYSRVIQLFLKEIEFDEKIDVVGLHGQTIHHLPHNDIKSTLQIGSAAIVAFDLNVDVVSNFREMDIAAGGEGAPLVAYTDWILFHQYEGVILQNIGGIGNLTLIPKNSKIDDVMAFDTGPGNMMMNAATKYYYDKDYDENGNYASKGNVIVSLLDELLSNSYLNQSPPKTTGREMFGEEVTQKICERYSDRANDVICTLTHFTAHSIANAIEKFILPIYDVSKLVLSGGGAYNLYLVETIQSLLEIDVITQEDLGFSSDAKEAIAFAILAHETMQHTPNNVPSATGAKHPVVLGQVTYKPLGGVN